VLPQLPTMNKEAHMIPEPQTLLHAEEKQRNRATNPMEGLHNFLVFPLRTRKMLAGE
jgi:hypothetical protein